MMQIFSAFLLLICLFLFLYIYLGSVTLTRKVIPKGFKNYPFIGALPDFVKNRHRFLDWTTQVLRDCPTHTAFLVRPGNDFGIVTANPDNVEHILKTNFDNYPKGSQMADLLQDFLGTGIFNVDGHIWKAQRKTASYEFNSKSLRCLAMNNITLEIHTRLLPILSRASYAHRVLDLQDILERFAFDNICKLVFNVDPGCLAGDGTSGAELMQAFDDAMMLCSGRFLYVFPLMFKIKRWLNVGSERRLKQSIKAVHKFADEVIQSRLGAKNEANQEEDLLSRFMGREQSSPEFLRDMVVNFILAGRDTTSSALSWLFWILSSRPDVKQKVREELKEIRRRKGKDMKDGKFEYEDLREMQYLEAAIWEAMRLYPPVPTNTRKCMRDDVLPDGTEVKKDWFIMHFTYAMGRMESVWGKDWREFKPERWMENNGGVGKGVGPTKYSVFNVGPRLCVGQEFASIQMKSIAASVMELFEIEARNKEEYPQYSYAFTLRMKGGLPVTVRRA